MRSTAATTAHNRAIIDYGHIKGQYYYTPASEELPEEWEEAFGIGLFDSGTYTYPELWEEKRYQIKRQDADFLRTFLEKLEDTALDPDIDPEDLDHMEYDFFYQAGLCVGTKQGYTPF